VTTLLSDRYRPEVVGTVGYFVSGTALRVAFEPGDSIHELIRQCRSTVFEAIQHQAVPFHMLPRPPGEVSDVRMDDIVIQMIGDTQQLPEPFEALDWRPDFGAGRTFDLEFVIHNLGPSVMVNVLYGSHRFSAEFIRDLIASFVEIAAEATADPNRSIDSLLGAGPSPAAGSAAHELR
jgi:hypothetical protein